MHSTIVAEVGSWSTLKETDATIDAVETAYQLGVAIKGSQGLWWQRPDYETVVDLATGAGVLTAHLHYCEPGSNAPEDEAAAISAVVKDVAMPLGVWLELDDLGGKQAFELGTWVAALVAAIDSPRRRAAVLARGDVLTALSGLDTSTRLIVAGNPDAYTGPSWAVKVTDVDGFDPEAVLYSVNSPRGINPWDTQIVRLQKPREATTGGAGAVTDADTSTPGGDVTEVNAA
jgi:hypothetical protein